MTSHILIILFDEEKFITSEPSTVETVKTTLENATIHEDLEIYFLKMLKVVPGQKADTLSRIRKPEAGLNVFEEFEERYHFKDGESLKNAFNFIRKDRDRNDLKWYLVSIGHGSGHSVFDTNKAFKNLLAENFIAKDQTSYINNELPDKNLYISEIVSAAADLGNFPFRIGVFYNCDLTLLDNCFLLAKKFKYIIGSENYNSNKFLALDKFIEELNTRIIENWDSYYFVNSFFTIQKQKIDYLLRSHRGSFNTLLGASLFAINLQYLNNLFDYFNSLSIELNNLINTSANQQKYIQLRNNLVPSDAIFIDLFHFLNELEKINIGNNIVAKQISLIRLTKTRTIIDGYVNLNRIIMPANLQGLSIYLPFIGENTSPYYARIRKEVRKFPQHSWYDFVDKIIALFVKH